jgi:Tfp pilus assembly protein PilN
MELMNDRYPQYLMPRRRHVWRWWGLLVLLLAAIVGLGWRAWQDYAQTARLKARLERLQDTQAKLHPPPPDKLADETAKKWAALQAERGFAWEPLFRAVERSTGPGVELLEFQPDKATRTVSLSGEAKDQRALIAFLNALAAQSILRNVYLAHQQVVAHDRLETISFEIKATLY